MPPARCIVSRAVSPVLTPGSVRRNSEARSGWNCWSNSARLIALEPLSVSMAASEV